jgi:nicotinamidase-related amidase
MPLTQLDPLTALVVIDLQKGIAAMPTSPYPISEVVSRSAQLARAFRQKGLPVVLVNVKGGAPGRTESGPMGGARSADWAELVPELEAQPSDHLVTKMQWGAFEGTSLDQFLRRRGVTQIVLTGVATCFGVESTARSAHEHGYNVTLVTDAMADRDAEAHKHSVEKIFPRLGETTTTEVLLKHLAKV